MNFEKVSRISMAIFALIFIAGCSRIVPFPRKSKNILVKPPGQIYLTQYKTMQLLGDFNGWAIENLEETRMELVEDWTWIKVIYFSAPRNQIMFKFVPDQNWDLAYGTPFDDHGALEGYAQPNQGGTGNHIDSHIPEAGYWQFEFHEDNGFYRIRKLAGPPGGIDGYVRFEDIQNPPYPTAEIGLFDKNWNSLVSTTSDSLTGYFKFEGLEKDTYNLIVSASGYLPDTITGIWVQENIVHLDTLYLKKLAGPQVVLDGIIDIENEGWILVDSSVTSEFSGANLGYLYYTSDENNLYIAIQTKNSDSWDVAYGIGIDSKDGGFSLQDSTDAWHRKVNFSGELSVDYELYLWWSASNDSVTSSNLCSYENGSWNYQNFSQFAYKKANGLSAIEIKLPFSMLNLSHGITIKVLTWVAGGDNSSAVDAIPDDPTIHDSQSSEWTDRDIFTNFRTLEIP